jgi:hypothetical protein
MCEIPALVAPCFSSNMVLQANNSKTSIYGAANATTAGDTISVSVSSGGGIATATSTFTATAAADGSWEVSLGAMGASSEPITLIALSKSSGTKQTLTNVLIGDVYVCSGQSNMALSVNSGYLPLTLDIVEQQVGSTAPAPRWCGAAHAPHRLQRLCQSFRPLGGFRVVPPSEGMAVDIRMAAQAHAALHAEHRWRSATTGNRTPSL